ncbi:MAG: DNA polymerase IV [Actinobacteria bacterium]|nr:DNA polymerase IV [Actinomycetota bacterium]MBU4450922.1 DNA polymerase IV [Actinomycetota bacterium]MCG2789681.1 DNA polymerase IV [Actinomycetes bacterium]
MENCSSSRKIIHIDMDAFFAQVEQRDHPEYKNKPLIVGGPLNRGVISSASYEARKFGLHAGMPLSRAKRLCPEGIFVTVDMEKYLEESRKIRQIFFQFSPLVEIVGCDEGFLDVTGCEKLFGSDLEIAKKIKGKIYEQTNLTSSAGIGPNKFLAKLASNMGKPNGLTVLENSPEMIEKIRRLPVSYVWGVGRVTCEGLNSMGIKTIGDLSKIPVEILKARFGQSLSKFMNEMSNGIDDREVIPYQEPKSIGREITFSKDIDNLETLKSVLLFLSQKLSLNLHSNGYKGRILTIKIRYSDFKTFTKRITLKNYTSAIFDIYKSSVNLLKEVDLLRKKIRLLGLSVGGLKSSSMLEDSLFNEEYKGEKLTDAIEKISDKYGENRLTVAGIKGKKPHK